MKQTREEKIQDHITYMRYICSNCMRENNDLNGGCLENFWQQNIMKRKEIEWRKERQMLNNRSQW